MGRHKAKDSSPKKDLLSTHLRVVPSLDEVGRHLHICSCAYHYGIVHPSAFESVEHCGKKCDYFKKFYFENPFFDDEELLKKLETEKIKGRKHVIPIRPARDEDNRPFYWIQDRGIYVYIARPKTSEQISQIDRDHFKLYIDNLTLVH
jgi:hypothetical protein